MPISPEDNPLLAGPEPHREGPALLDDRHPFAVVVDLEASREQEVERAGDVPLADQHVLEGCVTGRLRTSADVRTAPLQAESGGNPGLRQTRRQGKRIRVSRLWISA